jgi:hypothetical protein
MLMKRYILPVLLITVLALVLTSCQPGQTTPPNSTSPYNGTPTRPGGETPYPIGQTTPPYSTSPYNGTPTRPGGETPYPTGQTTPLNSTSPYDGIATRPGGETPYPPPNGGGTGNGTTRPTTPAATTKKFVSSSPISVFTAQDIQSLGIKVTGTPREMADAIRKWQETNMSYGPVKPDFSDAIRWNYFLPGVFPSRQIVSEHIANGKPYGICFDFAVIYSSIANYYGLETRVRNSISKPSDTDKTIQFTTGMAPDEYDRIAAKLGTQGYKYDFDAVRRVASETPSHYWAEVKIDGVWVIEDATQSFTGNNTQTGYVDKNDVQLTDWMRSDKSAMLYDYQVKIDSGQRLPE